MKATFLAVLVAAGLAVAVPVAALGAGGAKTKTLSGAVTGGEKKGSISMKVVIKNGEVKQVKSIVVSVPYTCETTSGFQESTATATLPGPYKATHINGHPNFFTPKVKVDGLTWTVGANMPDDKASKAIGTVKVSSVPPGGGECMNPSQSFVAR
jgi:hypothetical protein